MEDSGKKTIKDLLNPQEKKSLETIYKKFKVPTDQLRRCPDILQAIAAAFDRMESRRIEAGVLLRYMFNRRKKVDWPKLGKRAEKFPSLLNLLTAKQISVLEAIYRRLNKPVDLYQFQPSLMRQLSVAFAKETGAEEDGEVLAAVMTARRKRGLWPTLFEEKQEQGSTTQTAKPSSFADIEAVDRLHKRKKAAG